MNVTFTKAALPKTGIIVIPQWEGAAPGRAFKALDKQLRGALSSLVKASDFKGKQGQIAELVGPVGLSNKKILLLGAGKLGEATRRTFEVMGGRAVGRYYKTGEKALIFALDGFFDSFAASTADDQAVDDELDEAAAQARIAFGACLRAYSFDQYKTKLEDKDKPALNKIIINSPSALSAKAPFEPLENIAAGVFLTRDLVSEPANILYPDSFAQRCQELKTLGVDVEILDEKAMARLGMGALLGVGQGSVRDSRLVIMRWQGGPTEQKPVCFIGKGVTFDTGGISLKPPPGMGDMKWDMGGAGAVTGAMRALAGRKAKANVVGILGLVENMPDGNAQRPGDVVTSMSGQTIEVLNTDAEGRLVLADALTYAQQKINPQIMIDLATLTGAILVSLEHEFAGLFSPDDTLCDDLLAAGKACGDLLWRMPLTDNHDKMIKSSIADMQNIGKRYAGSSSAAAFLKRFVEEDIPWAHLDIAGVAWRDKGNATTPSGGTGFGVRLLDEYIKAHHETA